MTRTSTEKFKGSEAVMHDTIMVGTHHHTFVETCSIYNTKCELSCKLQALGMNDASI